MDEFRGILRYRVNFVFMNGLWPYKCKHTSELCGLPHVLCFKELQGWHHVTLSCHIMSLSLSLSHMRPNAFFCYIRNQFQKSKLSHLRNRNWYSALEVWIITSLPAITNPTAKLVSTYNKNIPVIASRAAASLGSYQTFLLCPHYERERDARISMMTMSSTCRSIYAVKLCELLGFIKQGYDKNTLFNFSVECIRSYFW